MPNPQILIGLRLISLSLIFFFFFHGNCCCHFVAMADESYGAMHILHEPQPGKHLLEYAVSFWLQVCPVVLS